MIEIELEKTKDLDIHIDTVSFDFYLPGADFLIDQGFVEFTVI